MRLEDITAGGILAGLDPDGAAYVIAVRWIGRDAFYVAYRVNGAMRVASLAALGGAAALGK